LARRATIIKDLKKQGNQLLILDAGNSLFEAKASPSFKEREKARLIATAYQRMGYHAVNVGFNDLLAGIEFLRGLQREVNLPLVSANLLDGRGGKPVFETHVVLDAGGTKVGLLGLTSDVAFREGTAPEGYFISNPVAAAKRVVAELAWNCDIIVALGNLGSFKEYTNLVQQVEQVDFIFGSGGKGSYHQTIRSDGGWKALLFQTYPKGQYLGRIDFKVVDGTRDFVDLSHKARMERQIKSIERQLDLYRSGTGMAKSIPQDKREEYIKKLEEFKERTEAHMKKLELDSQAKGTFFSNPIRLDDKVQDNPEIKGLVDRFKKGS
jgi:2',3'-cyclic-nucleotide 2'-phosphodiesterase (5'-nucleotidase family)